MGLFGKPVNAAVMTCAFPPLSSLSTFLSSTIISSFQRHHLLLLLLLLLHPSVIAIAKHYEATNMR